MVILGKRSSVIPKHQVDLLTYFTTQVINSWIANFIGLLSKLHISPHSLPYNDLVQQEE